MSHYLHVNDPDTPRHLLVLAEHIAVIEVLKEPGTIKLHTLGGHSFDLSAEEARQLIEGIRTKIPGGSLG
jgi:hypothetical protein